MSNWTGAQLSLHVALHYAGENISRGITQAKSSAHPLQVSDAVLAKLIEAQQAVFAAQRLLEAEAS